MNSRNLSGWLGRIFRSMLPAVALATAALGPATGWSQDKASEGKASLHAFVGSAGCQSCHSVPNPYGQEIPQDFVLLDEYRKFHESDKHAHAFTLLTDKAESKLGVQICEQLGIADVAQAPQCLSCHANWHYKEGFKRPGLYDKGVTCEACHGAAKDWIDPHKNAKEWRPKTAEEKLALGMIEVRNPVDRAKQCFSCHIGNAAEGKVVTHDMYAAGHPPLPGIEVETFAESMPSHWRNLKEKGEFAFKDKYLTANFRKKPEEAMADLPRFKNVVFGGVIALRESVNLVATQAQTEEKSWPELAVFDCAACHHELRIPSWRQHRASNSRFKPGRPQSTLWPSALVKLGVAVSAKGNADTAKATHDQLAAALADYRAALDEKPFGEPAAMRAAADKVIAVIDGVAKTLETITFDKAAAEKSLEVLTTLGPDESPDFHSARQMAWAYQVIYTEMNAAYPEFAPRGEVEAKDDQEDVPGPMSRMATAARVQKDLETLAAWRAGPLQMAMGKTGELLDPFGWDKKLLLTLPAGTKYEIGNELPRQLKAISEFDQHQFLKELMALPTK